MLKQLVYFGAIDVSSHKTVHYIEFKEAYWIRTYYVSLYPIYKVSGNYRLKVDSSEPIVPLHDVYTRIRLRFRKGISLSIGYFE